MGKIKMLSVLLFALGAIMVSGCIRSYPTKETIIQYVQNQREELIQLCNEGVLLSQWDKEDQAFLRRKLGSSTIVKAVTDYSDIKKGKVEFYCGGSGFVGGSTSVGFYYSADDQPFALEFDNHELSEIGPGRFEWKNEDESHLIYTERICEKWFYYYMDWY